MAQQFHVTMVLAALIGVGTGLGVFVFHYIADGAYEFLIERNVFITAVVPALGLAVVGLVNRFWGSGDTATTDGYVRSYHQRAGRLRFGDIGPKLTSAAITLGTGNAFGFEGPAMLIGGTIGSETDTRFASRFRSDDAKVLMVAGAAAGIAAVFKAPLTGVVFALEVPYRSDLARRALLPSLVAAGSAYVTYVLFVGTTPLLSTGGSAPFDLKDLGGGLVLGAICGILARIGAWAIGHAKRIPLTFRARVAISVGAMVAMAPLAHWWFGAPLHLGGGYEAIEYAEQGQRGILLLIGLFALRAVATAIGVAGGGVGGLFIPLVAQGAITGSIFQQVVDGPNIRLFPTVGIAAFLGAGYRTPLAGVAFVAEATGQPGFLVPALLAAATAQLTMGSRSFSPYQRAERRPDIEPLTRMPISDLMSPNADTVEASATLDEVVETMLRQNRRWAPVVDDGRYFGLIAITDIGHLARSEWPDLTARDVARTDLPPAAPGDRVTDVAARLRSSDSEAVAVTERDRVIGVMTLRDLTNVEQLLDRLANQPFR